MDIDSAANPATRELLERLEQSKREAQANEERFALAVQGANDGLWDWDVRTDVVYYSPRWKGMLGYADDEIPHRLEAWERLVHPDDLPRALATVRDHLEGDSPYYELEHRLRHKDGTYRWILARGASLRDPAGRPYRMAGWHTDITERKRSEEQLRAQEEQYRAIFEAVSDGLVLNDPETDLVVEANPAFCRMHGYAREELIGLHPTTFIHPDYHAIFADYSRTIKAGGTFQTQAVDLRLDGTPFPVEVHGSSFLFHGRPHVLGVVRDVTERARVQRLLEERVAALSRIAANLTFDQPIDAMLDALAANVVRASGAVACGLGLIDNERESYRLAGTHGLPNGWKAAIEAAWRAGADLPSIAAARERRPVVIRGIREVALADPRYAPLRDLIRDVPWDTVASVPLVYRGRVVGTLTVNYLPAQDPSDDELAFLAAIADQAAVAVETTRLFAEAQGKAMLEERQRLARELHDSVSQALYGIGLGARTARVLLDRDPSRVAEPLADVVSLAEAGLAEMRALLFELRPESLAEEGLIAALRKQAAAHRARHGIVVDADLGAEPDVPLSVKEALHRIAQEALHNAAKHARAGHVALRLGWDPQGIVLEVTDDGVGFDPTGKFPGHLGLVSMRERAERLGGTLAIISAPGQGTHVRARLPLVP